MGIHVYLHVIEKAVPRKAWEKLYDDALRLLRAHPAGLLGIERRRLLGSDVVVYAGDVERTIGGEREICLVGDRRSLRTGESFHLPRRLGVAVGRVAPQEDLVFDDPDRRGGRALFHEKTQGEPYHTAVLAAAMLVETRLPWAALVAGDVDEDDVEEARRWAEPILGHALDRPVLFDAPALLRRLSARWQGEALVDAFVRRFEGTREDGLGSALAFVDRGAAESWTRARLGDRRAREDEAFAPARVVQAWLTGVGDVLGLCELACVDPRGARMAPELLASLVAESGALLPADLSRRIDRCRAARLSPRPDVSMLGALTAAMFLERHLPGRRIDPGELEAAFARAWPDRAAELSAVARAESERHEAVLASICASIEQGQRFLERLPPYQDVGDLAALRSAGDLTATRRQDVAVFARALRGLAREGEPQRRTERRASFEACLASANASDARRFFVAAASQGRVPRLTEDAWSWILAEEEPRMIRFLLRLFCCEPRSDEAFRLKRALLEGRALCEAAARMAEEGAEEAKALAMASRRREAPC
jgi:hypothetical protein